MDCKNYQNARDQVWELLIRQDVRQLPVRVSAIFRDIGIAVKVSSDIDSDGFMYLHKQEQLNKWCLSFLFFFSQKLLQRSIVMPLTI